VRGKRGVDKGRNISRGFWGGGLHLPLSLDVSVSMEHSEGLLGTNRGVNTSRNSVGHDTAGVCAGWTGAVRQL